MDKTCEIILKTHPLPAEFKQDQIVSIDRFDDGFMLQVEREQLMIFLMNEEGKMRSVSQSFAKGTPTVRINREHLLVYDRSNANFSLITNNKIVVLDGQYFASEDANLRLFFFKITSQICLVEKWGDSSNIKITYFRIILQQNSITAGKIYQPQQYRPKDQNINVFKLNEYGTIGWASSFNAQLQMHCYNDKQGYKKYIVDLGSLCPLFNQHLFHLLQAWTKNNLLYIIVSTTDENIASSYSNYSPIVYVDMEIPQAAPAFIEWRMGQETKQLSKAYSIEDYCIFVGEKDQSASSILMYSKQSESTTLKDDKFTGSFFKGFQNNTITTLNSLKNEIVTTRYTKQCSLPTRRMLQTIQQSQLLSKTIKTAILIFGSVKSGKSTLRYHLSGEKLILKPNDQLGYSQLISQSRSSKGEQDWQHHACGLSVAGQEVAIIEIPDWIEETSTMKAQLQLLLSRIFKIYQQIHFVVTIPMQEMEDSYKNDTFFSELFSLMTSGVEESKLTEQGDGIQNFMSIILTRVDCGSESVQIFRERIEQIKQINSYTGGKIEQISSNQRVLSFENREVTEQEGLQLLKTLLGFDREQLMQKKGLFIENYLMESEDDLKGVRSESIDIYLLTNAYLLWIGNTINNYVLEYTTDYIQSYQPFIKLDNIDTELNKEKIATVFLNILVNLKKVTSKQLYPQFKDDVGRLRDEFVGIAELIFGDSQEKAVFKQQMLCFCTLLRFSITQSQIVFPAYSVIFNDNKDSIFSPIILSQIIKSLSLFQTITELEAFKALQKSLPKTKGKTKKIQKIQMTYQQEKTAFLKLKSNLLQRTCLLPSNALKLDLLLHQLSEIIGKPVLSDEDYRCASFFIRESSHICQYHSQYHQSLILLSVIPDFNGIQLLLDDYVSHLKKNMPYDSKKYFTKQQSDLLQTLLTIGQIYARQSLVKKLINIMHLSMQLVNKTDKIKKQISKYNEFLPNKKTIARYRQRLHEEKPDLQFYDFKNNYFLKMMEKKEDLIERCLQFENSEESRKKYENRQTYRYLLDCVPIVAL